MPTLTLSTPSDYDLPRDACSYGYFLLAPNRWIVAEQSLARPLQLADGPVLINIYQPGGTGHSLRLSLSRTLRAGARREAIGQIIRMLRLDEDEATIRNFHRADPRFARSGRGRLFRSPTLFEDVIKTVTSCNVTWPSTVQMNLRLCQVLGEGDVDAATFPVPAKVARTRPQTLRARCRVGYRDGRIVELARRFRAPARRGGIDLALIESPSTSDDDLFSYLVELPGIGPYAAANIMQLLGRYSRLPLDTESVRHGRTILGYKGSSAQVMKRVHRHFAPFGVHAFRSYWFELWDHYERRHGPSHTWERDSTGRMFTAALLNRPLQDTDPDSDRLPHAHQSRTNRG
ncbi:MAG: hypothetical protein JNK25_06875 [Phycisphaerae bacterium]|nr:hypothetical protein [Phycisphaerae bacterium]